jgi:tetratricopeptide (TPR) repeat protein
MDRGEYDVAIRACGASIDADPEFGGAYYRRSFLWRQVKDLDKAIADLTKAIERSHTDLHLMYLYRALAWFNKRMCAAFSLDMGHAVAYRPDFAHPYLYGDDCKVGSGDLGGAIRDFSGAIKLMPKWAHLYFSRGEVFRLTKKCDRAIADYTTAIKLAPRVQEPYARRAECRKSTKDYKGALADYTTLIELSPQNKDYYMGRAKTYGAMGLIDKTIADFEQVKRIQPDTAPMMDRIIRGLKMRIK